MPARRRYSRDVRRASATTATRRTMQATARAISAIPRYGATSALRSSNLSSGAGRPESSSRSSPLTPRPCGPGQAAGVSSAADGAAPRRHAAQEDTDPPMAKCVRGSSRPGRRRPVARRTAGSPARSAGWAAASAPRSSGLTDAELKRAAELEAQLVAEEQAAETARRRTQERATAARELSSPARTLDDAEAYAYVARDLKDIGRIAILLLVVLFALYIAIDVAGVFRIT